jgi:glutamyl-tRNA reductase
VILCLSASYKTVKLPMLESLAFKDEADAVRGICSLSLAEECVLVQTCHRVEVYGAVKGSADAVVVDGILRFWSGRVGVSLDLLRKAVVVSRGKEALERLFSLASGLDSMVVGEDQILGQVRRAYVRAKKAGAVKLVLDRAFMCAINTGRKVRSETRIDEGSVSVSSAAVDLAARELGGLRSKSALVVGAGEAGSIAAETLRRRGAKAVQVANRTYERAVELARRVSGEAVEFDKLYDAVGDADLVIAAVVVDRPIITAGPLKKVLVKRRRGGEPLFLMDISTPRAVEEAAGSLCGVVLRNIDDLKGIVEESVRSRLAEAERARRLVLAEVERFERQQLELAVAPLISMIYRRVDGIRRRELERALSKMGESDARKRGVIDRFSRELVERVLQLPIDQLREAALNNDDGLLSAVEKLFKLKS